MKPKYVVCPGMMTSKTDGQTHYVGSMQLMRLYGVAPQECEIYEPAPWWPRSYYKAAEERQQGMIRLHPRYDGDYTLPSNALGQEPCAAVCARSPAPTGYTSGTTE